MSKPICFKIRGGVEREDGSRGSTHIGKMAGKGYLGSEDLAFTCLSTNDQYLFAGQGEGSYTYPFNKPPMKQRKLKYLSLFSGIEAASVAWKDIGWEPVGFAEIEPFPSAVLKHRFPNTPNYGDITKWKEWGLVPGTVDVVCAGSPCQAFSVAGLRKGLDDPRGNLALVTLGLVEFLKPKWFIWENVPGVLTAQSGSAFGAILTALGDIGYGWSYRVLDAQYFGVAQRRRRVWLCAYRDPVTGSPDWRPPTAVLSFSESLRWNPAKSWKKRKSPAGDASSSPGAGGLPSTVGTLCADTHPGAYSGQDAYTGRLIPAGKPQDESKSIVIDRAAFNQGENAQYDPHIEQTDVMVPLVAKGPHAVGVPKTTSHWDGSGIHPTLNQSSQSGGGIGYSNQELFSQGGGGLVPADPVAFRKSKRAQSETDSETWVDDGKANTLNNFDLGDTRTTHAVVESGCITPGLPQRARVHSIEGVSPTLSAEEGRGHGVPSILDTRTTHLAVDPVAFSFDSLASNSMKSSNPNSGCRQVDVSKTIDTTNPSPNKNQGGIAIVQPQGFSIREDSSNNTFHAKPVDVSHCVTSLQPSPQSQHAQNFIVQPAESVHQAPGDVAPTVTFQPGNLRREAGADSQGVDLYNQTLTGDIHVPLRTAGGHGAPATLQLMAVRRLTPTECLRLQGFPDGWTQIPWKGKPAEECPDGPQYKAAGNSWAVPCARYIGERINMVEEIKDELSQKQA